MSSRAEDYAKSEEVGTHEVGHQSDLSSRRSSAQVGKFGKTNCGIMLRFM